MPTLKIDGREVTVEPGTRIMEAADRLGIPIPRFCYHPGLSVAANCRMCLVETNKSPKLVPSCYDLCQDGMEVQTRSERVRAAQKAVLEFILLHHPVDCPICDQAGECDLQDQYFQYDYQPSRHAFRKQHKPKARILGPQIIYDAERCINCTRCVRFCDEVAKAPQLRQVHRGERTYIDVFPGRELDHPYSMCTADVCPVGALTTRDFRFKCRVWFLHGTPSVCAECSRGCSVRVDTYKNKVQRVVPRHNPLVNHYWACDAGRLAYHRFEADRAVHAMSRGRAVDYPEAVQGFADAIGTGPVQVVLSPFMTCEDAVAAVEVFRALTSATFFLGGRPDGDSDEVLIRADKNPNRRGLQMVLQGFGVSAEPLTALSQDARLLVVFGDENLEQPAVQTAAGSASSLVVFSALAGPVLESATFGFPITTPYESDGTYVNEFGVLQRVRPAVSAPGEARGAWRVLLDVAEAKRIALPARTAAGLFESAANRIATWAGLSYLDLGEFGVDLNARAAKPGEAGESARGAAASGDSNR